MSNKYYLLTYLQGKKFEFFLKVYHAVQWNSYRMQTSIIKLMLHHKETGSINLHNIIPLNMLITN